MLSTETRALLEDFEKRMRFVNTVKYFTERSVPNEIREMFPNPDLLDNAIIMTMLFIMDHTLRYGERCTIREITGFLQEISEHYDFSPADAQMLSDYIITDVLQSGGKLRTFGVFSAKDEQFRDISSRLLSEQDGCYSLTDEAFEFLFRTKEIDSELDFSVSRFKLNEFIKRGNYSKALRESRELLTRIRSLKTRMDDFMLRCRMNVSAVSVDEYEEIVSQVKFAFEDEHKQLNDIRNLVYAKLEAIIDAVQSGKTVSHAERAEQEIREILRNIDVVIEEQSRVYNKKFSLSDCYGQLLDEDFSYFASKRFDFEKTILTPARKMTAREAAGLSSLFVPLWKPVFPRHFSIENFYAPQKSLAEKETVSSMDLNGAQETEIDIAETRNQRYIAVILALFSYAAGCESFCFSEFMDSMNTEKLAELTQENTLMNVMLKLYAMGTLDIAAWRSQDGQIIVPAGEFDLSYCLSEIPPELTEMERIHITACEEIRTFAMEQDKQITMNDFRIEVIR